MARDIDIAGLEGGLVSLTSGQLDDLDSRLEGRLLLAGDDGWEEAVEIWNGMVAKLPALVVQPASAQRRERGCRTSPATTGCCSASKAGATTSLGRRSPRMA